MGYSLNRVEDFGPPFQVVHDQVVLTPASGYLPVRNVARKILFVLSGECRHRVVGAAGPGADVHLRPGDVLILPHLCEQRYSGLAPGQTARLHVVRLSFDPERLPLLPLSRRAAEATGEWGEDAAALAAFCTRDIRHLRSGNDTALQETLGQVRDEARRHLPGHALRVHGLCVGLLVLVARRVAEHLPSGPERAANPETAYHVGKMKDYLRGHLARPTRLADVAGHVGLTEEYAARLFRRATGGTVMGYLRRLRIAEARTLLATTDRNLSEVARDTGFASLTVFSRTFRQETGVTPSEFRQDIARQMG